MTPRSWIITGSLHMALAVIFGAFAAHALKNVFSQYSMDVYKVRNVQFLNARMTQIVLNYLHRMWIRRYPFCWTSFLVKKGN